MKPYYVDTFFKMTSKELFEKIEKDFDVLVTDISADNIFNYFVSAYHLKDYIKEEFSIKEPDIRSFEGMDELLNLSGFIANKGKHFSLTHKKYSGMETRYYSGKIDGTMRIDGTWKIGEGESYKILKPNGDVEPILEIAKRFLDGWRNFISSNNLFVCTSSDFT